MNGLTYIKDFITEDEENKLITFINSMEWNNELSRRTQQYGYKYNYSKNNILEKAKVIPHQFNFIINAISQKFNKNFDQLIINEYVAGQGISPHIDHIKLFDDTIISISLGSPCVMKFTNNDNIYEQILDRRSMVALQSDVRYKWKHSIPARKSDNNIDRTTRISLTFRKTT